MKIAFFGDVHGCVLHALGAAVLLQRHREITLDALIQVGDLGAFPSADRWDEPTRRFAATTPAQGDFFRLLDPSPGLADGVRRALAEVPPFTFLSGNHEDHAWLAGLHAATGDTLVPVDPLGAYRHVPCGEIVEVAGQRVAFLGRIEAPGTPFDYDEQAFARTLAAAPGSADILVTHDGPYGLSRNMRGEVQGSARMTALIEHLRPRLHVGGHYHHENGPRYVGDTVSYTLAQLVPPVRTKWSPEPVNPRQQIVPGSIALLDTDSYAVEYIHDDWLADVHGDDLDLTALLTAAEPRSGGGRDLPPRT